MKKILWISLVIVLVVVIPSIVLIICGRMEKVKPTDPQWGIVQSVENVTSTGLTIVWDRDNPKNIVGLHTGEEYSLERKTLFGWRTVSTIIQDYAINTVAYSIGVNMTSRQEIDWKWLYGELPKGTYRIGKTISMDVGGRIVGRYYTEFKIK